MELNDDMASLKTDPIEQSWVEFHERADIQACMRRTRHSIPFLSFLSRNTEHPERKKKRGQKNLELDNTGRKLRAPSQIEINHTPIAPTDRDGIVFVFLLIMAAT